jgi:hypothetical protein
VDSELHRLIAGFHASPYHVVFAATGGGTAAASLLLGVPGSSRTVLEVIVPYDERTLTEFLGHRPDQFCSAETSRKMADRACDRAKWLAPAERAMGLGCTASLVSDKPKRGDHRFHVTVRTDETCTTHSLTLVKGARDRKAEESVLDAVLLNLLAEAAGISPRVTVPLLPEEQIFVESRSLDGLSSLLQGKEASLWMTIDGQIRSIHPMPAALLPGAFNPLHAGHLRLASVAAELVGGPVAIELSVINVDKPPLGPAEIRHRLGQFVWQLPVTITRAATFDEKATLFPGVVFIIGADTAKRIVAARYYTNDERKMVAALAKIRAKNCRFLVAGRHEGEEFVALEDLPLPSDFRDLFAAIPQSLFSDPISSTALRGGAAS